MSIPDDFYTMVPIENTVIAYSEARARFTLVTTYDYDKHREVVDAALFEDVNLGGERALRAPELTFLLGIPDDEIERWQTIAVEEADEAAHRGDYTEHQDTWGDPIAAE